KHFYACTQEGTENQVYLSLIMYCLLALFKQSIITRGTLDKIRFAIRASIYEPFELVKPKLEKLTPY
ncbi:hypothetical protein MRX50_11375, partial [Fusibacter sp. A2]|nr:hypothetical protein [Fusibacter sp. A2]